MEYNPKMQIIIELIHLLYALPDCSAGGCCHIVTDDDNIDDDDLMFVIDYCRESDNNRIDKELSCLICELLLQLSREQRICLFYMLNVGWFDNIMDEERWNEFFECFMSYEEIMRNWGEV